MLTKLTETEQEIFEAITLEEFKEFGLRTMRRLYVEHGFSQRKLAELTELSVYQVRKTVGAPV